MKDALLQCAAWTIGLTVLATLGGCAEYTAPGPGANMAAVTPGQRYVMTDDVIAKTIDKKPLAAFPAAIAVARIQSPGYKSESVQGWGTGNYSIVTSRDVESEEQFDRLTRLPMVNGIAPMNRLLLPEELKSDVELRQAAARMHADFLLIYTIDTTFYIDDFSKPLTVVSLGLSPNQNARVLTTASAVLLDTRNGYIYGVDEGKAENTQLTNGWDSDHAVDQVRRKTESEAFNNLMGEFEKTWKQVVTRYAVPPATLTP